MSSRLFRAVPRLAIPALAIPALVALVITPASAEDRIDVVATIAQIADVAQTVAGECALVSAMVGPGSDPHLYEPTPSDVRALQQADLILFSGYGLEGQLGDILDRIGQSRPVRAVTEAGVERSALLAVEDMQGVDPHVWMSPALWALIVPVIVEDLSALAPDCAEAIAANAETYEEELAALDAWVAEAVATIPEGQRRLITAHDAFGYFGTAYGIDVDAIQGLSTESEPSIADIDAVAQIVAESGVPAVFVESTINPRTIQAMIEAVAARGQQVEIGGTLFSDSMGAAGSAEGTYIGMIHANTVAITLALGGTPPALPNALSGWAERWQIEN